MEQLSGEDFYGPYFPELTGARQELTGLLYTYAESHSGEGSLYTVQSITSRIKSPDSMVRKLKKRGLPQTAQAAVRAVHDALGIRVICSFTNGVYRLADWLKGRKGLLLVQEKDYISYPKANGYRSYHMIFKRTEGKGAGLFVEIQIRTIAQDFWGSLEHQIKYKHEIPHEELIRQELKRCADEIASIDLTLQTIQELILGQGEGLKSENTVK